MEKEKSISLFRQQIAQMEYCKQHLLEKGRGQQHGSHWVYRIPIEVFRELPIGRWKYNRPADMDRVVEIGTSIEKHKRMDGMIYLAFVNHELVCYESNHRREALKGIAEVEDILVDVLWNVSDEDVKNEFQRLNKAISVPELYIIENNVDIINDIRAAVDAFCKKYSGLRVPSGRPQRPNFNRDGLTDEFCRVVREMPIGVRALVDRLEGLNARMAEADKSKLSAKVVEKCEKSGLWLFAWSARINEKDL
jgi:hypothetical protein